MEEVKERKRRSDVWYILLPIFIVIAAFILYTIIQYFEWTAEPADEIEWSEKDINIG